MLSEQGKELRSVLRFWIACLAAAYLSARTDAILLIAASLQRALTITRPANGGCLPRLSVDGTLIPIPQIHESAARGRPSRPY